MVTAKVASKDEDKRNTAKCPNTGTLVVPPIGTGKGEMVFCEACEDWHTLVKPNDQNGLK